MNKTQKIILTISILFTLIGYSQKEKLAEDPFEVNKYKNSYKQKKPWDTKTPKELRVWAQKNLHQKLTARKVFKDGEHPEWEWFRKSGLGIFLHWGLPSTNPDTGDAWAIRWSEKKEKSGRYMEPASKMFAVADSWNPEKFDPNKWLKAASKAGFGYAVFTTRHHDGYALWPSNYGEWDTGDKMHGRDLVKDYVEACRVNNMKIGFYYSGPNWHYEYKNKDFEFPDTKKYTINYKHEKVATLPGLTKEMKAAEKQESKNQVRELMRNYGPIDVIWWDGNVAMEEAELKKIQPNIFVATGNIATPEGLGHGKSESLKVVNEANWWWEMCVKSENKHSPNWHYGIECETNHWDTNKLLTELIRCRALGGNLLVNVPPKGNGEMMDWFYEVCLEMENWMQHSREAIYDVKLTAPLPKLDITKNYTTVKGKNYYSMPDNENRIEMHNVEKPVSVVLLRTKQKLNFDYNKKAKIITVFVSKEMRTSLPDMVKISF
ncbi:alpha-L-fucosidase [Tamlana sedimentorum]|uniref:alpha-L-fucosidase n=1 Tax=Neotamlana sedimentorum TaxID=1435349 RepID=A0A0D7WA78_9FLAO|nr:alpha-L-fucosidase [Tamlana sedimentorum]KJD35989.1 alpha-L-fucosidase [Tamlana sedimentorum]